MQGDWREVGASLSAMTVTDALKMIVDRLECAGIPDARREAIRLLDRVIGIPRERLLLEPSRTLVRHEHDAVLNALSRRVAREPVTRIAGSTEFYGRRFRVTPDVLDPRSDSEVLIDVALQHRARWGGIGRPRILDVGTGSGCLLGTLLAELPEASGVGIDLSAEACAVAMENVEDLGVGDRAQIVCHDAGTAPQVGRFNLIVSNPPYVAPSERDSLAPEVSCYDPDLALFAVADGLACYRSWMTWLPGALVPGGGIVLEIGWWQAAAVVEIVKQAFPASQTPRIEITQDLQGHNRSVAAWTRS